MTSSKHHATHVTRGWHRQYGASICGRDVLPGLSKLLDQDLCLLSLPGLRRPLHHLLIGAPNQVADGVGCMVQFASYGVNAADYSADLMDTPRKMAEHASQSFLVMCCV